jgi:hypothetical protein
MFSAQVFSHRKKRRFAGEIAEVVWSGQNARVVSTCFSRHLCRREVGLYKLLETLKYSKTVVILYSIREKG